MHLRGALLAAAWAWIGALPAWAMSPAPGAETLFTQLEHADAAVVARLARIEPDGLVLAVDSVIRGNAPGSLRVPVETGSPFELLDPSRRYIVLLQRDRAGDYRLPLGGLSVLSVPQGELSEAIAAAESYVQAGDRTEERRAALLRAAGSRSEYVQRSAVVGLTLLGMMDRAVVGQLVSQLDAGRLTEPEACRMVIRSVAVVEAVEHGPFLERRIRDRRERPTLRESALFALFVMDPSSARRVAASLGPASTPSLEALRRSLGM